MPSILLGQPYASGPQVIVNGNPFSGSIHPIGGILVTLGFQSSGAVHIGLSGNMTLQSGGFTLSGFTSGFQDGLELKPGGERFYPKTAFPVSGVWNLFCYHDAACSGLARLYYEWRF